MPDRDDELDGHKIQQIARLRRSIIRSRSYAIIAAVACAVAAVNLAILAVQNLRAAGIAPRPTAYATLGILAIWSMLHFIRKTVALHREYRETKTPAAMSNPDFSTLSDGSQLAKNLEEIE